MLTLRSMNIISENEANPRLDNEGRKPQGE